MPPPSSPTRDPTHVSWLRLALSESLKSPPLPTNYRVGALLIHLPSQKLLASGYTLELPGNTHAEQVCLHKFAKLHGLDESQISDAFSQELEKNGGGEIVLYTTMEPCQTRSTGNLPCVDRILRTRNLDSARLKSGISTVFTALKEPDWLVKENRGQRVLEDNGVEVVRVEGFDFEAWSVATAGHVREAEEEVERDERVRVWKREFPDKARELEELGWWGRGGC